MPAAFVTAARQGTLHRERGSWQLRRSADAWGWPLETELSEVYADEGRIVAETRRLARDFPAHQFDGPDVSEGEPGFIPYIDDFSEVICFGVAGDGAPFCFDFRADQVSPGVIWWEDAFWRRVAPDWASFAALFDLGEQTARAV